jgi:hypothetical protein
LADRLGLQAAGRRFLRPAETKPDNVKLAVYVPLESVSPVFRALTRAGAGALEKYEQATFRASGTGTYKPLPGANPTRGAVGELVQVEEVRLEALCPLKKLPAIVRALHEAHPYEEPAFDLYPLLTVESPTAGLGLIGALRQEESIESLVRRAKKALSIKSVGVVGDAKKKVHSVAICTGAGGDVVRRWRAGTADLFVTGEMTHHDCAEAHERGLPVMLVGHWASEAIVCERFAAMIGQELDASGYPEIEPVVSKAQKDPLRRM